MDQYPDGRRARAEEVMAIQSTAMAGQNLLLAAHAERLGACWTRAPLFAPEEVRDVLGLPATWMPQGLFCWGTRPRRARRKGAAVAVLDRDFPLTRAAGVDSHPARRSARQRRAKRKNSLAQTEGEPWGENRTRLENSTFAASGR
jgi:hypothetical protein